MEALRSCHYGVASHLSPAKLHGQFDFLIEHLILISVAYYLISVRHFAESPGVAR